MLQTLSNAVEHFQMFSNTVQTFSNAILPNSETEIIKSNAIKHYRTLLNAIVPNSDTKIIKSNAAKLC